MTHKARKPQRNIARDHWLDASRCADELKNVQQTLGETKAALEVAKKGEKRAQLLALYDPLTKLANRALFEEKLNTAIAMADRRKWRLAILFIDIDSFKAVNDTCGHEAGDIVLREIARRLVNCVREEDTASRYGGDEFVCLLIDSICREDIAGTVHRVMETISAPIKVEGQLIVVSASIGISVYPDDGMEALQLIRNSDVAMYRAKKEGLGFHFYSAASKEGLNL